MILPRGSYWRTPRKLENTLQQRSECLAQLFRSCGLIIGLILEGGYWGKLDPIDEQSALPDSSIEAEAIAHIEALPEEEDWIKYG